MSGKYLEPRVFRSPYSKLSERVSAGSILWALLLGPIYFWRKRAPVEALVLAIVDGLLWFAPDDILGLGFSDLDLASPLVWIGCACAAPALLSACYLRKGWAQVA